MDEQLQNNAQRSRSACCLREEFAGRAVNDLRPFSACLTRQSFDLAMSRTSIQVFLSLTLHERNLLSLDFLEHISKAATTLFLEQKEMKKMKLKLPCGVAKGHPEKVSQREDGMGREGRGGDGITVRHRCCCMSCGCLSLRSPRFTPC